jgi:hypothetical protein
MGLMSAAIPRISPTKHPYCTERRPSADNGCGQNDTFRPCDLIFEGGPSSAGFQLAPCALQDNVTQTCISIVLQLVSLTGKNFSFLLADGDQFCAFGINNTFVQVDAGVQ